MIVWLQPSPPDKGNMVGRLTKLDRETGSEGPSFPIYSRHAVMIGRDATCDILVKDPCVSNFHLRIYTVLFDDEDPDDIAPLVYARNLSSNHTRWNGYPMDKGNGAYILNDGDTLKLSSMTFRYHSENKTEECEFDAVRRREIKAFEDEYKITTCLMGSGGYGKVHMAYDKRTGQQFACKIIDLQGAKSEIYSRMGIVQSRVLNSPPYIRGQAVAVREQIARKVQEKLAPFCCEADILKDLCHPNIVGLQRVFRSSSTIYLVQELMPGGDLFSFLQSNGGKLIEMHAAVIIRQVVIALDYLHDHHIVHRDLKADNVLIMSHFAGDRVVLTDFGCARRVQPVSGRMSTMVGTFDYTAPEIIQRRQGGYTKVVDLWSLGCLTVVLLTGSKPLLNTRVDGASQLTMETGYKDLAEDLQRNGAGHRAQDFVRKLLILDPERRMTAKEALRHDWFTNKCHRPKFEDVYRRSIANWEPFTRKEPFIVDLEDLGTTLRDDVASPSAEPLGSQSSSGLSQAASITLSDPVLPPCNRAESAEARTSQTWPNPGSQRSFGLNTMESDMSAGTISTHSRRGRMPASWMEYEQTISVYHQNGSVGMGSGTNTCDSDDWNDNKIGDRQCHGRSKSVCSLRKEAQSYDVAEI